MPPGKAELSDVENHALMGLAESAGRFDPARGVAFKTFAARRIVGAVRDWQRSSDPGWTRWFGRVMDTTSLDGLRASGDPRHPRDWPDSRSALALAEVDSVDAFEALISRCNAREQRLLRSHYVGGLALIEIGREMGLSESRMSQMLQAAHEKIRKHLRTRERMRRAAG